MSQIHRKYNILQPLILAACVAVGMMAGFKLNEKKDSRAWQWIDDKEGVYGEGRIEQFLRFIEHKYVDQIDVEALTEEAVRAILTQLDPYSVYLSPEEVRGIDEDMNGTYVGIGVENYFINDTVQISRIIPGSPAEKAGLKVYDKLLTINNVSVAGQGLPYEEIKDMLSSHAGEKLSVKLLRNGSPVQLDILVQHVSVSTVKSHLLPELNTAYIKIDKFGSHTYREFMEEVEVLFGEKGARHLILDLRDNLGGYLPEAIHILCQIFEEKDRLLMYTKGRSDETYEYISTGKRFFNIDQIYVLIDENSASASEIVAGAIQDWDRGILIGRRSFGKGMVQEQYALNNGGAVRLTVSKYFTPAGRSIQRPFQDRDLFDHEVDMRYTSGEMFYRDSLKNQQTDTFLTQILKRPMFGQGGITPDVFMPLPEYMNEKEMFRIRYLIPMYMHHVAHKEQAEIPSTYLALKNWQISEDFFSGFVAFAEDQYKEKLFWPHIRNYEPLFKEEVAKQNLKEDEFWVYMQNEDAILKKAIDLADKGIQVENLKNE